jgi:hypothetical protein
MGDGAGTAPDHPQYEPKRYHPRQSADWTGEYALPTDPDTWRPCRIIDISSAGAGIELEDADHEAMEGAEIVVRVRLRGVVRHARDGDDGSAHAGLEFIDAIDQLRAYLASFTGIEHHG